MKIFYATLDNNQKLQKTIKKIQKKSYKSLLIQIYSGISKHSEIITLLENLKEKLPNAVIIGASTAGEITKGKLSEKSVQISFTLFDDTKLKAAYVKKTDKTSAKKIAKKIKSKNMKAAIILSEGLNGNHIDFLETIHSYYPNLIIAGGLAGDNFKLKKTYIIFDDKIYESGSLIVSFISKTLYASNNYNLSWTPIGKEMHITKAEGNTVLEIDNQPATKVFKHYLGDQIFEKLPNSLLEFQLLFTEGDTTVARTPIAKDKNALIFAAPVKSGQKVQFGFSNAQSILSKADKIASSLSEKPAEAIYIFSCIARKSLLGNMLRDELQKFEEIAPTHGFITYGEYYKTDNNNALLNCTTTLLILSENPKPNSLHVKKKNKTFKLGENTFNSLLHLIKQTTSELNTEIIVQEQYKKAVDSALLVSKTDYYGNITYVNDNFCKVSGYSKEELIGKNHNIIRHPDMPKQVFKSMWKTILSGKIWHGRIKNRAKDAKDYTVDATISPIFDDKSKIVEFIALRQNVTKQVKVQESLKRKEKEQRMILDNQDAIVLFASKHKGVQVINRRFFELFDYKDIEDFKSKHSCICDLFIEEEGYVYPNDRENWLDFVANHPEERHKVKMRDKFNKIRTFLLKVNLFDNKFVVNISDITALEEALLKANLSEHAKSMFVANMSHEIRTPLNGILGFTDVLLSRNLAATDKKYLNIIHKSGETLLAIVDDILDISKIESGQMQLNLKSSNLSLDIESVVAVFATRAKEKNIQYNVFIDPHIPRSLLCDSQRIKQVLSNLISNAIKFTPAYGEINVEVIIKKQQDSKIQLHFKVKDSGIGIEKKNIVKVFQAFSQADNSISREYGGTGLGLPISAKFVEMMDSQLKIKSKINFGTQFYFDLWLEIKDSDAFLDPPKNPIKIAIFSSKESRCYSTVESYLKSWNQKYDLINNEREIDKSHNILILCLDDFSNQQISEILEKFSDLQIISIESSNSYEKMEDKRLYHLEQPIIGSMLYDAIISKFPTTHKLQQTSENTSFNANILVAEDNKVNQLLISTLLEDRNINFKIADNGEELIELYKTSPDTDLIFMDVNMPVLDGVEATKHLRELGCKIPIVALTANVMAKDKETYSDSGMDAYLSKPIIAGELDKILLEFLANKVITQTADIVYDEVSFELLTKHLGLSNMTILRKLISQFHESSQKFILALNSYLEDANEEVLKDLIHQIKGVVGNLRFTNTYELCQKIEEKVSENDVKALIIHMQHLKEQSYLLLNK
jgi:PAS domain S-box-containing protein